MAQRSLATCTFNRCLQPLKEAFESRSMRVEVLGGFSFRRKRLM